MSSNEFDRNGEALHLNRRRFLQGLGGTAMAAGLGVLNVPNAFSAPVADFSPWFGSGGPSSGAGIPWEHGISVSMTGPSADIGLAWSRGAQLAAEIITASGGPKMLIAVADNQSGSVPAAVQGARRLIAEQKISSLTTTFGATTEAIFPLTKETGITTFWTGGAKPSGLDRQNVFITIPLWALDPTPGGIAFMAKHIPGAKRLALLGVTENGMPAVNDLAPKAWSAMTGGQVVYKEFINAGGTDFSAPISKIRAAKPDLIYTTLYGNDAGFFVKQVREAGMDTPILMIDLSPAVSQIAGDAIAQNCYLANEGYLADTPNPYNQAFVKAFKAKYSIEPNFLAANFFEGTMLLWASIQRVIKAGGKPGRGPDLANAIEKNPAFPSLYGGSSDKIGQMVFNKDHSVTKTLGVFQIGRNGAITKLASISKGSTDVMPA